MGFKLSCAKKPKIQESLPVEEPPPSAHIEQELLLIKNHPDRARRLSSIPPQNPGIKEDKVLEVLCNTTDIEPDVGADEMGKKQLKKLVRKISQSEKFSSQFQTEEDFKNHFRGEGSHGTDRSSLRLSRKSLEIPSAENMDKYIEEIKLRSSSSLRVTLVEDY